MSIESNGRTASRSRTVRCAAALPRDALPESDRATTATRTLARAYVASSATLSRSANFWILPVDVLGIASNTKRPGTL